MILGFELTDMLVFGIMLSVLNIIFSHSSMKLFLTWGPTLALALVIKLLKNGKADNYLIHLIRYKVSPGHYHAFTPAKKNQLLFLKGKKNVRLILEQ